MVSRSMRELNMKSLRNRESVSMDPPAVGVSFTCAQELRLVCSKATACKHSMMHYDRTE